MDSPYKDGEPPRLDLDYCFQIGDTPVYLMIGMENGAPRLSFVILATPSGVKLDPPERVHLATFKGVGAAVSTIEFLSEAFDRVDQAIAKLAEPKYAEWSDFVRHVTQQAQEPRNAQ
jgi:hypothetical protein